MSIRTVPTLLLGALLALGACNSNPPPAQPSAQFGPKQARITSELTANAQVVAVDPAARLVTLRREDSSLFQLRCGEGVRNFAQITVGDRLRVQYQETLTASLRPAGEAATPVEAAAVAGRAAPGAKPAGGLGVLVSVRVKIESIDREREIVVFSLASGEVVARRIMTPEGREFVKGLKVGDTVQLDFTESLALAVEKA